MKFEAPVLLVFHGATGGGAAERMVADARADAVRTTARAAIAGGIARVIVATDQPGAFADCDGIVIDSDAGPFDFLGRVRRIVASHGLHRPVVMGSGSLPLMRAEDFARVVAELAGDGVCVTNNFFSSDLTGWTPGTAIAQIADAPRDNMLPRRLRDEAGLRAITLPRTTATHFDIDTPVDVAILALSGDRERALPPGLSEVRERLIRLMLVLCDRSAELVVAGRAGSEAWRYLERETACRVRMFSEERGMAAAGRGHQARSVLGYLVEEVGVTGFFERMATLGDALVLDTRVLEAHFGVEASREDRFQSDMLNADAIEEPFLRELTRGARESRGLV
ncbi:MAG TPA: hypothetical protein VFK32_00600, partial [Tepidiformaceae bacterium]|nr:hypothetical protein [Tepidiformaceae bacterium]